MQPDFDAANTLTCRWIRKWNDAACLNLAGVRLPKILLPAQSVRTKHVPIDQVSARARAWRSYYTQWLKWNGREDSPYWFIGQVQFPNDETTDLRSGLRLDTPANRRLYALVMQHRFIRVPPRESREHNKQGRAFHKSIVGEILLWNLKVMLDVICLIVWRSKYCTWLFCCGLAVYRKGRLDVNYILSFGISCLYCRPIWDSSSLACMGGTSFAASGAISPKNLALTWQSMNTGKASESNCTWFRFASCLGKLWDPCVQMECWH